ncbi:hypothetical protein BX666DRAFT_2008963, partial [Dichotomocladium elegans]
YFFEKCKKRIIEAIIFQEAEGKNSGKNYLYVYSMKKDYGWRKELPVEVCVSPWESTLCL